MATAGKPSIQADVKLQDAKLVYSQECMQPEKCEHVMIIVGNSAFQLCKPKIVMESDYFAKLLDPNNWKEGKQTAIEVGDMETSEFMIYIKALFPKENQDFHALESYALISLMKCADRFGSLDSISLIKTILAALERAKQLLFNRHNNNIKRDIFLAYNRYNMDQCPALHQTIIDLGVTIHDVHNLQCSVKSSILAPIVCKLLGALIENPCDKLPNYIWPTQYKCKGCRKNHWHSLEVTLHRICEKCKYEEEVKQ